MEYRYFIYPLQISLFQSFCILLSINFFFQPNTPLAAMFLLFPYYNHYHSSSQEKSSPLFEFFSLFFLILSPRFISRVGISNIFKSLPIFTEYIFFIFFCMRIEKSIQHLKNVDKVKNTVQGAITHTIFSLALIFLISLGESQKVFRVQ